MFSDEYIPKTPLNSIQPSNMETMQTEEAGSIKVNAEDGLDNFMLIDFMSFIGEI